MAPSRAKATLVLLSLGHFFIDLYSSALGAFQPVLVERFGMTLAQAGVLGGVMVFSSSVMQPAYGLLTDRWRTRLPAALSPAIAGIFISALGAAPSYAWLVAMVALGGTGIAAFHPQASSRAVAGVRENRGRAMAAFISAGTLGMAFGPTYFSALFAWLGPAGAWSGAIPGVLVSAFLLLTLPVEQRRESQGMKFDFRPLAAVWKPLMILYLLVFIRSIVQVTYAQFLPLYLHRERGFSVTEASHALTLYLAAGAIGGFLGGSLADRFGGKRVILVSMAGCLPFLALFFATGGAVSLAALALTGLILLFTIPVNVVMAQELAPGQAGTVSALMMGFAWGTAGVLFIPLTGWAADHFGLHATLATLGVFPLAGFFLTLKLPTRPRSH